MINDQHYHRIACSLPFLQHADPQPVRELMQTASLTRIRAGRDIFVEGDRIDGLAVLISGVVRVYKIGETGREITLYRFGPGESCILTANAILSRQSFPAIATVEQEVEAVLIPANIFRDWVRRYDVWHEFVFALLAQRLSSVMAIVEEVTFRRMNRRIASFLLERSAAQHPLCITHQEIAAELGSSREVVSRILEEFAAQNLIRLTRGTVEILDRTSLQTCANV